MTLNIREGFRYKAPEAPGTGVDKCNGDDDANYDATPLNDREPSDGDPGDQTFDCSKELRNLAKRLDFLVHDGTPSFSDYYPDVIAVQESNLDAITVLVNELNQRLPGAAYTFDVNSVPPSEPKETDPANEIPNCGADRELKGEYVRDSGIIYNAATVSWQDGGDVPLTYGCAHSKGRDRVSYRVAQYGLATDIASGRSVAVLSVHPLVQGRIDDGDVTMLWEKWAHDMRAALYGTYPTVDSRVITGDINNRMCVDEIDVGWCNKTPWWKDLESHGYHDTVKKARSDLSSQWTGSAKHRRIDFIFYKGEAICGATADNEPYHGTKYVQASNKDHPPQWDKYVTDHRPVFATVHLRLQEPC